MSAVRITLLLPVVLVFGKTLSHGSDRRCSLRCGRIDYRSDLRDLVRREPAQPGVLAHRCFVRGDVDTVGLVVGDVTLNPLDLWTHGLEDIARLLRDGLQLRGGQLSDS